MSDNAYWWIALGLGAVVAVVAIVLLQLFLNQVHRIERGAGLVWQAGKEVAANTATTWLLDETVARLDELAEEAGRHEELLRPGRSTGGGRGGRPRATTQGTGTSRAATR